MLISPRATDTAHAAPSTVTYKETIQLPFSVDNPQSLQALERDCAIQLQNLLQTSDPPSLKIKTTQNVVVLCLSQSLYREIVDLYRETCVAARAHQAQCRNRATARNGRYLDSRLKEHQDRYEKLETEMQKQDHKHQHRIKKQERQMENQQRQIEKQERQIEQLNSQILPLAMRAPPGRGRERHRTDPRRPIPQPEIGVRAADVGAPGPDEFTVKTVLNVDGLGLHELRAPGDAAAHEYNEDHLRAYCSSTVLRKDLRSAIQKSFLFLFPRATPLEFA
ncbi:hypothetical protein B0H14DRAFT_3127023 [Mycena olivaceomarginata]|nr:hypothetical protein B0H14DRAFT_3127023 [Mycena olivaceomarginata]